MKETDLKSLMEKIRKWADDGNRLYLSFGRPDVQRYWPSHMQDFYGWIIEIDEKPRSDGQDGHVRVSIDIENKKKYTMESALDQAFSEMEQLIGKRPKD